MNTYPKHYLFTPHAYKSLSPALKRKCKEIVITSNNASACARKFFLTIENEEENFELSTANRHRHNEIFLLIENNLYYSRGISAADMPRYFSSQIKVHNVILTVSLKNNQPVNSAPADNASASRVSSSSSFSGFFSPANSGHTDNAQRLIASPLSSLNSSTQNSAPTIPTPIINPWSPSIPPIQTLGLFSMPQQPMFMLRLDPASMSNALHNLGYFLTE